MAALVAVFIPHPQALVFHNSFDLVLVGEDALVFRDLGEQIVQLVHDLLAFQTRQTTQLHLHDRVRLHIVKREPLHQPLFRGGHIRRVADDADNLVDKVAGGFQRFPNVRFFLCLAQIKLGAAGDDLHHET